MKKPKLKFKIIILVALSVELAVLTLCTSTFSWFVRPNQVSGNSLSYSITSNDNVKCYDGNGVTISANKYSSDGINYTTSGVKTGSRTLAVGKRDYYHTTITNSSENDQNVSLYITSLTGNTSGELAVGVNSPVKAYRNYTKWGLTNATDSYGKVSVTDDRFRIYFEPNNANEWSGGDYDLAYKTTSSSDWQWNQMGFTGSEGVFYTDVTGTNLYTFYIKKRSAAGDYAWGRTPDIQPSSVGLTTTQAVDIKLKGTATSGYGNADYNSYTVDRPRFINKFGTATITVGDSMGLRLTKDEDYLGKGVRYESSDTSKFTVDSKKGVITGVSAGTATLRTYLYGSSYGEPVAGNYVETTIIVSNPTKNNISADDVPIVRNLLVPAGEDVNIHWFVMNDKHASGSVTYNLSGIYLAV